MASIRRYSAFLVIGVLGGCASAPASSPSPSPSTPREAERPPLPTSPTTTPTVFTYREGNHAYELRQLTTVTVGAGDTTSVEDTLQTIARLTLSITPNGGVPLASVTVDSLTIVSARDTVVRQLVAPVVVQLPVIPLTPPPITDPVDSAAILSTCDSMEEAARILGGDVYVPVPVLVEKTRRWSDSTITVLCRGGIPLTVNRVSHFEIADVRQSSDSIHAVVRRQTTLTLVGSGMQGSRRITVRGEGTSETIFTYELRSGRFLDSTGQSVLRLAFETIQQTEQVVQRSSSSVRLRTFPAGED